MAKAIVRQAELEHLAHREEHAEVKYVVAHGIASTLYGEQVLIGSAHFVFDDKQIPLSESEQKIIDTETNGYSPKKSFAIFNSSSDFMNTLSLYEFLCSC